MNKRIFYAIYGEFDNINDPLDLKSLQAISDEDAVEVAKMFKWMHRGEATVFKNSFDATIVKTSDSIKYGYCEISEDTLTPEQYDCLRSKGYALPYLNLSVDDMVKFGWITLKD